MKQDRENVVIHMTDIYRQYRSDEVIQLSYKDVFEDSDGYPNSMAFEDFAEKTQADNRHYYLVCLSIDLRKANEKNYAYGNYVLRKFVLTMKKIKGCYPFRLHGEKFNVLVEQESLTELKAFLTKENEWYEIYYGVSGTEFSYAGHTEQVRICVEQMYIDKSRKKNKQRKEKQTELIIGNKRNTPLHERETETFKNRSTMWYAAVTATVYEPVYKKIMLYIYPTQYCEPMHSIPVLVIADDMLKYRYFYGKEIQFGVGQVRFIINAHFDNDGHLNVSVFNINTGKCELTKEIREADCIPANFGKRFGAGEIYPIKENVAGYCDFIYLENGKAELNTTGIAKHENGQEYMVHMDSQSIHLIPFENQKGAVS